MAGLSLPKGSSITSLFCQSSLVTILTFSRRLAMYLTMRRLLLVVVTLLLAMTVAQAQGSAPTWTFFFGGFGSFTHFGTQLEQFPVIGFFPSPIFSRTVYLGRCFGFGPTCAE